MDFTANAFLRVFWRDKKQIYDKQRLIKNSLIWLFFAIIFFDVTIIWWFADLMGFAKN